MGFAPPTGGTKRNTAARATPFRKIILARIRLSNYRTRRITPYSTLCSRIIHPVTQRYPRSCNCFHRFLTPRISDSPGIFFTIVNREKRNGRIEGKFARQETRKEGRKETRETVSIPRQKRGKTLRSIKWLVSYLGTKGKLARILQRFDRFCRCFKGNDSKFIREANTRKEYRRECKEIRECPSFNQS